MDLARKLRVRTPRLALGQVKRLEAPAVEDQEVISVSLAPLTRNGTSRSAEEFEQGLLKESGLNSLEHEN